MANEKLPKPRRLWLIVDRAGAICERPWFTKWEAQKAVAFVGDRVVGPYVLAAQRHRKEESKP